MSSSVQSEPLVDNPGTTEAPEFPAATRVFMLEADLRLQLLGCAKQLATHLPFASSDEYLPTAQAIETLINATKSLEPR